MKKGKDKFKTLTNKSFDLHRYTLLIDILNNMDQIPQEFYYTEILDKINVNLIEQYLRKKKLKNIK